MRTITKRPYQGIVGGKMPTKGLKRAIGAQYGPLNAKMILVIFTHDSGHNLYMSSRFTFVTKFGVMIDLQVLLSYGAQFHTVEKGEALFWEGASCQFYYQVHSGQFKWVNIAEDGKEFIQRIIVPGQCIGEIPLFDGGTFAASAFALVKSEIVRLPIEQFQEMLLDHPELQAKFLIQLAAMLRFKFFMNKEIAFDDPERLILTVISYFKRHNMYIDPRDNLVLLTRQQIADLLGLRVETVIRVVRHLHDRKILRIEERKIYVDNIGDHA